MMVLYYDHGARVVFGISKGVRCGMKRVALDFWYAFQRAFYVKSSLLLRTAFSRR